MKTKRPKSPTKENMRLRKAVLFITCKINDVGNEAVYINEEDDVYAIGSNCSSCLGLGM
jgi:hypothetical protein